MRRLLLLLRDMVGFRGFLAELIVGSNAGFAPWDEEYSSVCSVSPSWEQLGREHSEGQSMVRQEGRESLQHFSVLKCIRDGPSRL